MFAISVNSAVKVVVCLWFIGSVVLVTLKFYENRQEKLKLKVFELK